MSEAARLESEARARSIFVPAFGYLLVHRDEQSEVVGRSGLIAPQASLEAIKPNTGKIIAAGPEAPSCYAPGVRVAFSLYSGSKLTLAGDPDYVLLPSSEVMAYAVEWNGSMADEDALAYLLPPPGQMFAERLQDDEGLIALTDNARTSTRSPVAEVLKKSPSCGGPFDEGDRVLLSPAVSKGFGLGFTGERPIHTIVPAQALGWYNSPGAEVGMAPDPREAIRSIRAETALDDRFDEGDRRAPR